jgi:hypothetical protein
LPCGHMEPDAQHVLPHGNAAGGQLCCALHTCLCPGLHQSRPCPCSWEGPGGTCKQGGGGGSKCLGAGKHQPCWGSCSSLGPAAVVGTGSHHPYLQQHSQPPTPIGASACLYSGIPIQLASRLACDPFFGLPAAWVDAATAATMAPPHMACVGGGNWAPSGVHVTPTAVFEPGWDTAGAQQTYPDTCQAVSPAAAHAVRPHTLAAA